MIFCKSCYAATMTLSGRYSLTTTVWKNTNDLECLGAPLLDVYEKNTNFAVE